MVTEQADIEGVARQFYAELFTAQEVLQPEAILDHVLTKVTEQMNDELSKPFTAEEVQQALFMMGANKAPGPDGFTTGFYQYHWELLGPSITKGVLDFLNGGEMPDEVNSTTLVLILKVKNPHIMKNFRPISLCNVIYKLCSKVLAIRLRGFLNEIVSEEQSVLSISARCYENDRISGGSGYKTSQMLHLKGKNDTIGYLAIYTIVAAMIR